MATNLQSQKIASLGKRLLNQISNGTIPNYSILGDVTGRRAVHVSVYDKNLEEHVQPSIVPDEVIKGRSANYWTPHPQTGVFGPTIDQSTGGERCFHSSPAFTSEDSSLDEKAFFRPLEDLDKPLQILSVCPHFENGLKADCQFVASLLFYQKKVVVLDYVLYAVTL